MTIIATPSSTNQPASMTGMRYLGRQSLRPHVGWMTGKLSSDGSINMTYFMVLLTLLSKPALRKRELARRKKGRGLYPRTHTTHRN